ncbi:MAG: hypothetical protein QJR09_12895 [Micrococcus sp.]|nr:hypothetical protein [Micrococcus sp.]
MSSGTSGDLMTWTGQFGPFIVGLALIGVAVLAWSGRWRGWAASPKAPFAMTTRNVIPFTLGLFGVAALFLGLSWNVAAGVVPGASAPWDIAAGVFAVLAWVSTLWWPAALTPSWYQDWVHRGGNEQTDPWPSPRARSKGHR